MDINVGLKTLNKDFDMMLKCEGEGGAVAGFTWLMMHV
jgi:hypothetical protein